MLEILQPRFNLRKPSSNNPTTIFLLIRKDKKEIKISTKLSVHPKFWNKEKQRVKKNCPESKQLNGVLDKLETQIKKEILNFRMLGKNWSLNDLDKLIKGKLPSQSNNQSFTDFFQLFIDSRKNVNSNGSIISYQNALRTLKTFFKETNSEDHLDAIDMKFYNDLLGFLYAPPRYSSINNAGKIIKHIKTVMNEAVYQGVTTNLMFRSRGFKKPHQKVNHIYLSLKEINQLQEVKGLTPHQDDCRQILICMCFLGIRWGDLFQVRRENILEFQNGKFVLKIITTKTKKLVVIPLHPIVQIILKKYNFQLPSITNALFNNTIKDVAKLAGIDSQVQLLRSRAGKPILIKKPKHEVVSSHIGRRSFITNMHLQNIDPHSIRLISGHQSQKEFENYIKVTLEENAAQLLNHNFFKADK